MQAPNLTRTPTFTSQKDTFFYGQKPIDLSDSPMSSKLMQLFVTFPGEVITREDILTYVYNIDVQTPHSTRFWETYAHNVVKLISRLRLLARVHWGSHNHSESIMWFHFDTVGKGWRLYSKRKKRDAAALGRALLG